MPLNETLITRLHKGTMQPRSSAVNYFQFATKHVNEFHQSSFTVKMFLTPFIWTPRLRFCCWRAGEHRICRDHRVQVESDETPTAVTRSVHLYWVHPVLQPSRSTKNFFLFIWNSLSWFWSSFTCLFVNEWMKTVTRLQQYSTFSVPTTNLTLKLCDPDVLVQHRWVRQNLSTV